MTKTWMVYCRKNIYFKNRKEEKKICGREGLIYYNNDNNNNNNNNNNVEVSKTGFFPLHMGFFPLHTGFFPLSLSNTGFFPLHMGFFPLQISKL